MAISERVLLSDKICDPLVIEDSLAVKVLPAEWKIDNVGLDPEIPSYDRSKQSWPFL